jgi:hypothetical protein
VSAGAQHFQKLVVEPFIFVAVADENTVTSLRLGRFAPPRRISNHAWPWAVPFTQLQVVASEDPVLLKASVIV